MTLRILTFPFRPAAANTVRAAAVVLVGFFAALSGCGKTCRVSSQCDRGEHCDFQQGTCIAGCKTDSDCAGSARCDLERGNCRSTVVIPDPPTDASTSTTTDAAAADAADDGGGPPDA